MDIDALVNSLPDPVVELINDLQAENVELAKSLEALQAGTPAPAPLDPIAKALDANPELAAFMKAKDEKLAEIEKTLEASRIEKANQDWITKSRSFDGTVDDPTAFGTMLREVHDANPAHAELITKTLSAAQERIRLSALFSEGGHNQTVAAGSAYDQATSIAKSLVERGEFEDIESARAEVWESQPALYNQYTNERRG